MIAQRRPAFAFVALFLSFTVAGAAELPSQRGQTHKVKDTQSAKTCNIAGAPGVLAANGVCVRFSGYVSSQFSAGQLK
jgi:hypothetical protein